MLPQRLEDTGSPDYWKVHDEIILEIPEGVAGKATVILNEAMIEAGKAYLSRIPVEVEVTIAATWAEK